jgi:hypothetical protein
VKLDDEVGASRRWSVGKDWGSVFTSWGDSTGWGDDSVVGGSSDTLSSFTCNYNI